MYVTYTSRTRHGSDDDGMAGELNRARDVLAWWRERAALACWHPSFMNERQSDFHSTSLVVH